MGHMTRHRQFRSGGRLSTAVTESYVAGEESTQGGQGKAGACVGGKRRKARKGSALRNETIRNGWKGKINLEGGGGREKGGVWSDPNQMRGHGD